ncbi:hypothetical protein H5392_12675 [Tessaracoccus sp. MC1865]|uniref:hypothetical protein n=1 Tax=Tessaracoccus sp. MC1865 TaxID=2760310 RepID=UPI00160272DD|nr:hypothetical protein [Tessaracoccus sp. MC1865]MBB1484708.1 hypothetical protein [Tessaracoccus sp. MC1865]QTO36348.1 hypothetical protein J7D54_07375 [Tessaracoccus sp. MC1865]
MSEVWEALGAALRLDSSHLAQVGLWAALGVALIAGASTMLGHTAILLLNRIHGLRLVSTLLLNIVSLAALHIVQAAVTWGVTSLGLRRAAPLMPLVLVGLLSVAPLAFAFIQAMPHFGMFFGRVLQGWSFLILWFGLAEVFDIGRWWALGFSLSGWFVMQLLSRLLQRPVTWVGSRVWTLATGRPTVVTSRDILAGMPAMPVLDRTRREAQA